MRERLLGLEIDGSYTPDFRRLVTNARMRLDVALQGHGRSAAAEAAEDAYYLLLAWDVQP
jgi:hypothetical protein